MTNKIEAQSNADICKKVVHNEFFNTGGIAAEFHVWTAKTANIGNAIRLATIVLGEENSIQNTSRYLF